MNNVDPPTSGPWTTSPERLREILEFQMELASLDFNLPVFLHTALKRIDQIFPCDGAAIEFLDGERLTYISGIGTLEPYVGTSIPRHGTLSGLSLTNRELLVSADVQNDERVDQAACARMAIRSLVVVPLSRRGVVHAILKLVSTRPGAFDQESIDCLDILVGLLGAALGQQLEIDQRGVIEQKLLHLAGNDVLTGLPNRVRFFDHLEGAIGRSHRTGETLAVMYFDIDHFKNVNDTYGHAAGDLVLVEVGRRLKSALRHVDFVGRLGGDEFTALCERVGGREEVLTLGNRVLEAFQTPIMIGEKEVSVTVSVGISLTGEASNESAEPLLGRADAAMYAAKHAGRNACHLHGA